MVHEPAENDGLFIVVSSLGPSSRLTFFQSVSSHHRIWLFIGGAGRPDEASWELPYIAGHTVVDTLDADAMLEQARILAAEHRISGIISYDEARIEATAKVAAALGLATSSPESIARCRDKYLTRQALTVAGVPQAESIAVRSLDDARDAAHRIGYPVVLKPRNLAASFGVTRVDSDEELLVAYTSARETTLPEAPEYYEDGVLVEEYLDGPEISVDSACFDGRIVMLAVAHKETGFPPSFEEISHVVDGSDALIEDPTLVDVVTRAHRAVGFDTGMTHVELKLTSRGPRIIEINARLGGDSIPYLGQLATGIDLGLAAAAIACGRTPDLTRGEPRVAAIRFYYPDYDIDVTSIHVDQSQLPAETERAVLLTEAGQRVILPPHGVAWLSRLAQVIVVADSEAGCRIALEAAEKAIVVEATPVSDAKDHA